MFLEIRNLAKTFGDEPVLRDVSLTLSPRETLSVLGRSGCGKTTLLKIIAGLEQADAGEIWREGREISGLPPQRRGFVYLYQEPLLLPHLDLFGNLAFGLKLRKTPRTELEARVAELAERLGLRAHLDKAPHQLSGGQRQRAAFGRAIAVRPALLLLDEPFSGLDVGIRAEMQALFKETAAAYGIPSLFVTHDLKEAILMGDRIARMQDGRLTTYNSVREFIEDPDSGAEAEIAFWEGLRSRTHE